MKNKKIKLSNKSIVALSAFLVLTLALSGLLFLSGENSLTGYQITQPKEVGWSIDSLKNKGSGWFSDGQVKHNGNTYVAFNVPRAQSNGEYDGRNFGDWDIRFTFDTSRHLIFAKRYPSNIQLRETKVSLKDTTLETCKFLLAQPQPLGGTKINYQRDMYESKSVCILLDNKDVFKLGFAGKTMNRRDFRWELLGNLKPAPTPTPTKTPSPTPKPLRVSIPIIIESPTVSLTGRFVTGLAPAPVKKTVTVKLSYNHQILKFTDLTLRTGADVKAKEVSPGQLEITYVTDKDLSPGELFKVNFEKISTESTSVLLDTAMEDGSKPVKIKKSTSLVKAT